MASFKKDYTGIVIYPADGHIVARNMYRSLNKYTSVHLVGFI
jgi:hypothetical protein